MKIVGLQKSSFVDYPKNIAAVLFLAGCNLNCWYCHNAAVCQGNTGIVYSQQDILIFLEKSPNPSETDPSGTDSE